MAGLASTRPTIERLLRDLAALDPADQQRLAEYAAHALRAAAEAGVLAAIEQTPGFRRGDFIQDEMETFLDSLDLDDFRST